MPIQKEEICDRDPLKGLSRTWMNTINDFFRNKAVHISDTSCLSYDRFLLMKWNEFLLE